MNWFERHLNWSLFLATIVLPSIPVVIFFFIFFSAIYSGLSSMSAAGVEDPEMIMDSVFVSVLPHMAIYNLVMIVLGVFALVVTWWYLGKKARSRWFLLLHFVPFGIIFLFLLENQAIGYGGDFSDDFVREPVTDRWADTGRFDTASNWQPKELDYSPAKNVEAIAYGGDVKGAGDSGVPSGEIPPVFPPEPPQAASPDSPLAAPPKVPAEPSVEYPSTFLSETPPRVPAEPPVEPPTDAIEEAATEARAEVPPAFTPETPAEPSREVTEEVPLEAALEVPEESVAETRAEVPPEIPPQPAPEVPEESVAETRAEVPPTFPTEPPEEPLPEVPEEAAVEISAEPFAEIRAEVSSAFASEPAPEVPVESVTEVPVEAGAETPMEEAPEEAAVESSAETKMPDGAIGYASPTMPILLDDAGAVIKCFYHPEAAAVNLCSRCGQYVCSQCNYVTGTHPICRNCWERRAEVPISAAPAKKQEGPKPEKADKRKAEEEERLREFMQLYEQALPVINTVIKKGADGLPASPLDLMEGL